MGQSPSNGPVVFENVRSWGEGEVTRESWTYSLQFGNLRDSVYRARDSACAAKNEGANLLMVNNPPRRRSLVV